MSLSRGSGYEPVEGGQVMSLLEGRLMSLPRESAYARTEFSRGLFLGYWLFVVELSPFIVMLYICRYQIINEII